MKTKIILLLITCFLVSNVFSQGTHIIVKENESVFSYDGTSADTASATTYTRYKYITIKEPGYYNYNIWLDIDSSGDGGGSSVVLAGRFNSLTDWTIITTVNWSGTVDTIIKFSNVTDYTEAQTVAAYTITAGDSILYDDTLNVSSQTIATTISQGGVNWPELRILVTGSDAAADFIIDDIVGIINRKK